MFLVGSFFLVGSSSVRAMRLKCRLIGYIPMSKSQMGLLMFSFSSYQEHVAH